MHYSHGNIRSLTKNRERYVNEIFDDIIKKQHVQAFLVHLQRIAQEHEIHSRNRTKFNGFHSSTPSSKDTQTEHLRLSVSSQLYKAKQSVVDTALFGRQTQAIISNKDICNQEGRGSSLKSIKLKRLPYNHHL